MKNLLCEGSVKDIYTLEQEDHLLFRYSDDYSIFDWGKMPNQIQYKGISLAHTAQAFFRFIENPERWKNWSRRGKWEHSSIYQKLCERGFVHHALGLGDKNGQPVYYNTLTRYLLVKRVNVLKPQLVNQAGKQHYDYQAFRNLRKKLTNHLVPLEVIFRFGVPEGSSLLKRTDSRDYLKQLGLFYKPKEGQRFITPVIEFSTKLEEEDRYVSYEEAKNIAGLNDDEFEILKILTTLLSERLYDCFQKIGGELWDGKFEFAFTEGDGDTRGFQLVDSIGPDELRIMNSYGIQLSKEFFRQLYAQTPWKGAIDKAKVLASSRGLVDWKKICLEELNMAPEKLIPEFFRKGEEIYTALAKAIWKETYHKILPLPVPEKTWGELM